ncbi:recombinase family protein [Methylobacterium pseudosasicola]|uniref:Site-specific DNA recombinase n=1 Tax=Methylobacterium pseudosasicola TaxID=582667 RepID=A0A1I4HVT0_9HYPH|nr:recombinase family protein [Methylobacterium pseudosasicola]SFL45741.1 Site-specific DNA recombinase [Methylobacterium pseudosasicola]
MTDERPRAYSYIRLSSDRQLKGDGERRQAELRDAFVACHGLILDDTLRDLGISAFDGTNKTKGALGVFLRKVEAGEVPRGSYLLVESLDRLSREHVLTALRSFLALIEAGIVVATLGDDCIYSEESVNGNWTQLIVSLAVMSRAHEESARKVQRLRAAWVRKREQTELKLTAKAPAWLELLPDRRSFKPIDERVLIVERMLEELAAGIGRDKIARRLNAEGVKPWGGGREWHGGTVTKYTDNPALIGIFQPCRKEASVVDGVRRERRIPVGDPIPDYYPRVISEDLWKRARSASNKRARKFVANPGGRKGTVYSNLFSRLAVCDACGSPMNYRDRGPRSTPCLRCSGNRNGTCANETYPRYRPLERAVLSWAMLSDRPQHVPATAEDETVAAAERLRDELRAAVDNLVAAIERGAALDDRLALRQSDLARAEEDLAAARREASAAPPISTPEVARGILSAIADLDGMPADEQYAARAAAAQELRDLITEIRCHVDGSVTVWRGEWGFRIRTDGGEAWIEGGVNAAPGECLALRWENKAGAVADLFLPPIRADAL